jgi:molecular chaperone GrpE (heat shock protein)
MSDVSPTVATDFSAQMQALSIEAESARGDRPPKPGEKRPADDRAGSPAFSMQQMLRPVLLGLESLMRTQHAQAQTLERLERAVGNYAAVPAVLGEARQAVEQRNVVNRAMFDALHGELKGYKDDFMLETAVRPVVRDLISLYDDNDEILRQVRAAIAEDPNGSSALLDHLCQNLEHHGHYIREVLERMEVRPLEPHLGKLDKRNQRVVAREPAESEDQDLIIVRSVRTGFLWRGKVVRPEEVVIRKWGITTAAPGDDEAPLAPSHLSV